MPDPITLFHISDIHFGYEDSAALDWVRAAITAERPAAVIVTGDLTMRARHSEFAAAHDWLSALDVPVTVEVGNHDMPYFNLWERFTDPYRRFHGIEALVEREIDLPGISIVPLRTTVRAQWRWPWSNGWVRDEALAETLAAIDALPAGQRVIVTAHHPLPERRERDGKLLTINGTNAMAALAGRGVAAVLSGHIHDAFDLTAETASGPLRMIGAGTLSRRIRSTPASFNRVTIGADRIEVVVRNRQAQSNEAMQIDAVPENALPPRAPGEPIAPVADVPPVDPPTH